MRIKNMSIFFKNLPSPPSAVNPLTLLTGEVSLYYFFFYNNWLPKPYYLHTLSRHRQLKFVFDSYLCDQLCVGCVTGQITGAVGCHSKQECVPLRRSVDCSFVVLYYLHKLKAKYKQNSNLSDLRKTQVLSVEPFRDVIFI